MKKIFWNRLHTLLHKLPFWNMKRAKNWHSELCVSTFLAFQSRRTLFFGFVLGSYCRKRHDVTVMWPFEKIFHRTSRVKIQTDNINKDNGCCGLACVIWLKSCEFSKRKSVLIVGNSSMMKSCEFLKRKSVLIVGNSSMMCLLQKFFNLTYMWIFFIFYETEWTCWAFLLPIRS